jgi:8-oxo-dGTP diphosphatase
MAEQKIKPLIGTSVIIKNDGKILLGFRKTGGWCFPGGHLEMGETLAACAIRETREETGIEVDAVSFADVTEEITPDGHFVTVHFLAAMLTINVQPQLMEPERFLEWRWFRTNDLPGDPDLFLPTRHFIRKYYAAL